MTYTSSMNARQLLPLLLLATVLAGCSPHPGAGNWKAVGDNEMGIEGLGIEFDGKAEFVSTKTDAAVWHCFWGGRDKAAVTLQCVPSSNSERRESFTFTVDGEDRGQLMYQGKRVATFARQPYE